MTIAFLLESIMMDHVHAERVVGNLGHGASAIPLAVGLGMPAYLNGLAALPLMSGLLKLGMVKPKVFGLYLGLSLMGSLLVAYAYAIYLGAA